MYKVLHTARTITLAVAFIVEIFSPLIKVLFSDNNSGVFKWNWYIFGTLIDIYVRYCTKQEL